MSAGDRLSWSTPSEQCTATSKRTRRRCGQIVPGGGVCRWHGGAAVQVERQREVRVALAQAQAIYGDEYEVRDPGEVLLAALADVDGIVQQLKRQVRARETLTGTDLLALGDWLDRSSKMAKAAMDAQVDERRVRLSEQTAEQFMTVMAGALSDLGHDPSDPEVRRVVSVRLLALAGGAA